MELLTAILDPDMLTSEYKLYTSTTFWVGILAIIIKHPRNLLKI